MSGGSPYNSHPASSNQADDFIEIAAPQLPPELEYEIFTIAYHQDPDSRLNLLLVSKRVYEWLIPVICKIMVIARFPKANHPPPEIFKKYGHHVKHILFSDPRTFTYPVDEGEILELCPNVFNLVLWFSTTTPAEVFNLRLERLTLQPFSDKFEDEMQRLRKTDEEKYCKWSKSITHIAWPSIKLVGCELLSSFPNLTHFLIGDWNLDVPRIVEYMVKWCGGLEVLVVLMGKMPIPDTAGSYVHDSLDGAVFEDSRVVVVERYYVLDWVEGARGGDDLWKVAERTVNERRGRMRASESL
ncbi:hypothetical protein BDN72DRAFT_850023 [Pluteus cervinus]|uniref:Uncharacterized protein n=1 Tax=Pluteus cervinus TaxID=181527 RepID=A0ACD3A6K7_9AGAR|nr:hypothetical protein BDN72DRAFT_850023 [Pluteus cervinus]